MYTQCPKCLTYFQVSADHLKVAQGNVRCGQCRNVFSALGNLTELPPQPSPQEHGNSANTSKTKASATNIPAKSKQQSNLSDAIAAIQALNQSSEKLHLFSEDKSHYPHQLGSNSAIKHGTSSSGSNSAARKLLQPDPLDTHENIPELNPNEMPEEFNDFNFDEALKAVDEIGIDNPPSDDSPIHYGINDDEDITPAIDGSHLVEDYTSSTNAPYIDNSEEAPHPEENNAPEERTPDPPQPADKQKETEEILSLDETTEQVAETAQPETTEVPIEATIEVPAKAPTKAPTEISTEEAIKEITFPDLELPETPPTSLAKGKIPNNSPVEQLKNIPSLPKQLIDDFQQDQHMLTSNHRSIITWGMGSLLLMFVFLGQTIYFKHNELGQINQLRPWIAFFCQHTNCELPMQSDITQLELLGQDIRSHPTSSHALLVSATIINNASYTQPYPGVQLNFSDINGEKVAVRNFEPNDYVVADHNTNKGMEPNTPFQIELEIIDPGKTAINFEFDFFSM